MTTLITFAIVARDFRGSTLYLENYVLAANERRASEFSWTNNRTKAVKLSPAEAIEVARRASLEWHVDAYAIDSHGEILKPNPTPPTSYAELPKISAFNTGRLYTSAGQRIAWTILSTGNVAMYDLDRFIDYVLIVPNPSDANVLAAYDANNVAPFNQDEYREARTCREFLADAARKAVQS